MIIPQGEQTTVVFFMVDEDDFVTPVTGATPGVYISKNGEAMFNALGAVNEVGSGLYKVDLTATDTDTLGPLAVLITATGCADWRDIHEVTLVALGNLTPEALADTAMMVWRQKLTTIMSSSLGDDLDLPPDLEKSALGALLMLVAKSATSGGVLDVYDPTNENNIAFSRTLTTNAAGEPITGIS